MTTKETRQRGLRVLIVEDEQGLCDVYREFVTGLGHVVMTAATAEEALEKLAAERFDVILLDIRLPGMSGLDFLDLPAVRESQVPVIAVSGVATDAQARECLKRGALDFIRKPVTLDRLSAALAYARGLDRRIAPRAAVELEVRLVTEKGVAWDSTCIELSATGMKVMTRAGLRPGGAVKLTFTPPGSETPLDAVALVIRADRNGTALWFFDLQPNEVQHLRALVDRLRPSL
jgi:CheY-like chemotaxis protein